jgi:hypothetical protein
MPKHIHSKDPRKAAYRVLVTLEASVEVDGDDERACVLAAREAVKNNPAALQVVSIKHREGKK